MLLQKENGMIHYIFSLEGDSDPILFRNGKPFNQNPQTVGFYERMGFETYKRTDLDEEGSPLSAPVYEG